jgi:hypothetical protein
LKLCTSISSPFSRSHTTHPLRSTTRPFRRVLGLLAGRSPPAAQGPCQQSTVQERQQHQDRRRQSRRAREGNPPVKGDCARIE